MLAFDELTGLQGAERLTIGDRWESTWIQLAQRITKYAEEVHEANKRTLDPIIIELLRDRERTS